jgi:hypothetical protein
MKFLNEVPFTVNCEYTVCRQVLKNYLCSDPECLL